MGIIDITGQRFGRLTVVKRVENSKHGSTRWLCRCSCGNYKVFPGRDIRTGHTKSGGCYKRENIVTRSTKHGTPDKKLYSIWGSIKDRCNRKTNKSYKDYGGRGITIFPAWEHDYKAFYEYVSKLPHYGEQGYSIDRIDNDGNYEPGNLRYADRVTQYHNSRRRKKNGITNT